MSVRVLSKVLRESQSEHGARLVLIVLADAASDDGVCWPSQEEIAEKTRLSARPVRDALRALEDLGELETRKAQRGRRRINVYRVSLDGLPEVEYDRLPFTVATPFGRPAESADGRELTTGGIAPRRPAESRRSASRVKRQDPKEDPGPTANAVGALEPDEPIAQRLVAFFVDESRERGSDPPKRVKGQIARLTGELLAEGVEPRRIALGIRHLLDRGLHPAALPSAVHEASLSRPRRARHGGLTPDEILARGGLERAAGGGVRPLRDDPARALPGSEADAGAGDDRRALPAASDE